MAALSSKEIEQLETLIEEAEGFIQRKVDEAIKYFLSTFYDDYAVVIYEHIKGNNMGDKFDEKTLRKELDIPNNVFNNYRLILSKNNIIFQTNKILKVSEYKNSYIWCLNSEKTCLALFYRLYRIHEQYKLPTRKESEAQYFCTNIDCTEYKHCKKLVDILCNIDSENTAFKCKLCSYLLKQTDKKDGEEINSEASEKLDVLNNFKQDTKLIYNLLYRLIIKFQDLYRLKNKLDKAKYNLEIRKIENYGKHTHSDDFYTITNDEFENIKTASDLTSIFSERKKVKLEVVSSENSEKIFIESMGSEICMKDIKDTDIDKMNDEEYEKYCLLLEKTGNT